MLNEKQRERYSRQIISPLIGEEGQEKISKLKVLQIGAGGLGSPCALYLVAAGIAELTIVDDDILSKSNLQRQILYREKDIGKPKVELAKAELMDMNSEVKIIARKAYVDQNTIEHFVSDKDFILDCSDNMDTKFLVNTTAIKHNIKCVIAGIKDFYGQIITIDPKVTACYECVFPKPDSRKSKTSDEGPLPVIGTTPGILGTFQALEVIKTALGLKNLYNTLLMVNLLELSFNKIDIIRDINCICAK